MTNLVNKLWILVVLYTGFEVYSKYEEFQNRIKTETSNIPQMKEAIKKNKKKLRDLERYFTDIEEAKKRIKKVASEVESIQRKFPSTISDAEYLGVMSTLAESLNIKNLQLIPNREVDRGFYFTKQYSMKAQGTFLQFLIFLEKISKTERLFNVSDVQFKPAEGRSRGRHQIVDAVISIIAYRYDENHQEDTGIEKIERGFEARRGRRK